jgi:hypothetical protein
MRLEFVEPSKRHADIIVPEGWLIEVAAGLVAPHIRPMLYKQRVTGH